MASEILNNIGPKRRRTTTTRWKWFYFKANSHLSKSSEKHRKKNMKVEIYEEKRVMLSKYK